MKSLASDAGAGLSMPDGNGLVFSYVLDGKGGGQVVDWDQIRQWSTQQGTLWLHLERSSPVAQKWLVEESGLHSITCESLLAEGTRPRIISSTDGLLLILRGVNCNPGADPEDMVSLRMWLDPHRVISIRHQRVMATQDIHDAIEDRRGPTCSSDFLIEVCSRIADRIGDVIADIDESVDNLEDTVLTDETHELRPKLATLRRQTISLRRYIAPQRDVMARLQNERISWLDEVDKVHFREIAERTARFVEDLDAARDRAAVTQEELNSRLSEQMNKTMYVLSLIASLFLPLGLLTGLLGVNVGGIPGAENRWGFIVVCLLLGALAFLQFYIFRRVKWL